MELITGYALITRIEEVLIWVVRPYVRRMMVVESCSIIMLYGSIIVVLVEIFVKNATKDVPVGGEYMNVKKLKLAKENFADGKKKGKSRPGRVKRSGASCKGSVSSLRSKAKKYGGERGKMYHWCANMKSGRKKSK